MDSTRRSGLSLFRISLEDQKLVARYLRERAWQMVASDRSGHLGGPSSSAELLTALYFGGFLRLDMNGNQHVNHDRVMIRGHLGPLRYAIFNLLGWIRDNEMGSSRMCGSRLQGHEKMGEIPGIDITPSGALGLVLSYGVGAATNARVEKLSYRSFVFLGDGEEQEGNVAEAARHAASLKLSNLIAIIDKNGKQLSRPTTEVDASDLNLMWRAYGWEVLEIADGHCLEEINAVYARALASQSGKPVAIIANTIKGNGLPGAHSKPNGYHTTNCFGLDSLRAYLKGLSFLDSDQVKAIVFRGRVDVAEPQVHLNQQPCAGSVYEMPIHEGDAIEGELVLLFEKCAALMEAGRPLYVMTADLIPKEQVQRYGLSGRDRFIDVGVREQHMFAMAHGLSISNPAARILIKSHDAFLYRGADQVQAIHLGRSRVIIIGDYGGLSGGFNGETHESIGQAGVVLTMPGAIVFEPADAIDFWKAVNYALTENPGLVYIRLYSRVSKILPRIDAWDWFYRTHEPRETPKLILVSSGLTAYDTMRAGQALSAAGVPTRVINVVQLTAVKVRSFAELFPPNAPVLTVCNGNPFILQAVVTTALSQFPGTARSPIVGHGFTHGESGSIDELKQLYGLNPEGIIRQARELIE